MIAVIMKNGAPGSFAINKPSEVSPVNEKDRFESLACNCVEVGTIIREDDTVLTVDLSGVDAETRLSKLQADAGEIGSGNCKMTAKTVDRDGTPVIQAMFDFDCTVEKLIFEMKHS